MRVDMQQSQMQDQICTMRDKIEQLMTVNAIREDRINELQKRVEMAHGDFKD